MYKKPIKQQINYLYNYTVYLSVHNFMCKIMDDAELLLTLYDAKSGKSFSENFVVQWPYNKLDQGWSQTDIFHNFRALFTVISYINIDFVFHLLTNVVFT